MQSSVVDSLVAMSAADRSYAGPFAYDSQIPMKVFNGNVPCVPLPYIVDAIESQNAGSQPTALKPQDVDSLRKVIGSDVAGCSAKCMNGKTCLEGATGATLAEKMKDPKVQACMTQAKTCYQSCLGTKKS